MQSFLLVLGVFAAVAGAIAAAVLVVWVLDLFDRKVNR